MTKPKAQVEIVTPAVASAILTRNTSNRPLSEGTVRRYAADITAGRWKQNGEAIKIASDGTLLDGQHRLHAIARAGRAIPTLVVRDLEPEVFDTLDSGKVRSLSDILALQGHSYTNVTATAARLAFQYISGGAYANGGSRLTRTALSDFVAQSPYLLTVASEVGRARPRFPNGALIATLFLGNSGRQYNDDMAAFIEGVARGEDLSRGDARYTLREWETAERIRSRNVIPTKTAFAACARAWNAFAAGKQLAVIKKIDRISRDVLPIYGFDRDLFPSVPDIYERNVRATTDERAGIAFARLIAAE